MPSKPRAKKSTTQSFPERSDLKPLLETSEPEDLPSRAIKGAVDLERKLILRLNLKRWPSLGQLRRSYKIFSLLEKRILAGASALLIFSTLWLGFNLLNSHLIAEPTTGGSYAEAIIGQAKYLNPIYSSTSSVDSDLTSLIYAGLLRYDKNMNLVGDLADTFAADPTGKVFTLHLRPNLSWQDGEPLTIDDVLFTFESLKAKDVQSPLAPVFRGVVVERVDDETIRFTLPDAYAPFLNTLTVGIIPKHIWSAIPNGQWRSSENNLRPLGAGPWQIDTINRDQNGDVKFIRLSPAPVQAGRPRPWLDKVIFKFYADEKSALDAFHSEQVEGLVLINSTPEAIRQAGRHIIPHPLSFSSLTGIFFNLNQSSALQTLEVRRALDLAIDRPALVSEVLNNQAGLTVGPFPTTTSTTQKNKDNEQTPETILESAGWKRIGALRRNKSEDILTVTLSVIDRQPDLKVAEYISEQWKKIGVDVKLDLVSPATPLTVERRLLRPRSYQALLFTIVYGSALDPYPFWHSAERVDPGLNLSMYSNANVDKAITKYRESSDSEERKTALQEIEETIIKDVPASWLYSPQQTYLLNESIKGQSFGKLAQPTDRFNSLNDWYIYQTRSLAW
jgi:peptide/nickel transport system substrate-binding protein